jgi:acetyl esterase/lipase
MGFLFWSLVMTAFVGFGLWPPSTHGPRATLPYLLGTVSSELYLVMVVFLVAPTTLALLDGDLDLPADAGVLVLPALALAGIGVALRRAVRTRGVLESALAEGLGLRTSLRPWTDLGDVVRVVVAPVRWTRRDVVRVKDLRYGNAPGRANRLDLYRSRTGPAVGPVLVYFHGGGYFSGAKSREARLLLERLAGRGWVCVSANYRLRPARFPAQVEDAKRVIAWLRSEGAAWGADPRRILLTGGSAGAHLAMICALTANEPRFQPGFEEVDTSVAGAVGCYGYYGSVTEEPGSSPHDYVRADAPPIMIIHGTQDPMAPLHAARAFAATLRAGSSGAVVLAELPGGLHAFDKFASIRSAAVASAIEVFATSAVSDDRCGAG